MPSVRRRFLPPPCHCSLLDFASHLATLRQHRRSSSSNLYKSRLLQHCDTLDIMESYNLLDGLLDLGTMQGLIMDGIEALEEEYGIPLNPSTLLPIQSPLTAGEEMAIDDLLNQSTLSTTAILGSAKTPVFSPLPTPTITSPDHHLIFDVGKNVYFEVPKEADSGADQLMSQLASTEQPMSTATAATSSKQLMATPEWLKQLRQTIAYEEWILNVHATSTPLRSHVPPAPYQDPRLNVPATSTPPRSNVPPAPYQGARNQQLLLYDASTGRYYELPRNFTVPQQPIEIIDIVTPPQPASETTVNPEVKPLSQEVTVKRKRVEDSSSRELLKRKHLDKVRRKLF